MLASPRMLRALVIVLSLAACGASSHGTTVPIEPSPSLVERGPPAQCDQGTLPRPDQPGCLAGAVTVDGAARGPAWVWVDDVFEHAPATNTARILMKDQTFWPDVLVVRAGTKVEFPNGDEVLHNVFSSTPGAVFDLGLYREGASEGHVMLRPGIVKVFCNIHPKMASVVLVVPGRLVAETRDGRYVLGGVPPGKHKVAVWTLGAPQPKILDVTVFPGATAEVDFTIATVPDGQHRNKEGMPYGSYDK